MDELTQRGITALRSGNRSLARTLLGEAVRQNPNNAAAWLWLTGALDHDEERIDCLKQVLRIDPNNQPAARGLSQILARQSGKTEQTATDHPYAQTVVPEASFHSPTVMEDTTPTAIDPIEDQPGPSDRSNTSLTNQFDTIEEEHPLAPPEEQARGAWVYEMAPSADSGTTPQKREGVEVAQEPSPIKQPATPSPSIAASRRKRARAAEPTQTIFHTRPSLVPALFGFWFFLFGSVGVGVLLNNVFAQALVFSAGLGFLLMMIVVYALARNLSTRYELTNHYLALRHRGQRTRVPIDDISQVECRQMFFQRIIGTGDVLLKAVVKHELVNLRMRNIPNCHHKVEQIRAAAALDETRP